MFSQDDFYYELKPYERKLAKRVVRRVGGWRIFTTVARKLCSLDPDLTSRPVLSDQALESIMSYVDRVFPYLRADRKYMLRIAKPVLKELFLCMEDEARDLGKDPWSYLGEVLGEELHDAAPNLDNFIPTLSTYAVRYTAKRYMQILKASIAKTAAEEE